MTEESSPQATVVPPIAIVGRALLDAVQAALPAVHKSILLVQHDGYLVVAASHGASNEDYLFGKTVALGDGFVGWAAESGAPQVRANMQYVPPDLPQLTEVEGSLESKSGMTVPMDLADGGFAEVAAYVCHGFQVFVLEDLDEMERACANWTGRLGDAHREEESLEWLEAQMPVPVERVPAGQTGEAVGEGPEADYTEQDMEVLLSVFGVDLTTKRGRLSKALKADVGEVMQRDIKEVFKTPAAPKDWASTPPEIPDESDDGASAGEDDASDIGMAPPSENEHYSQEDVGKVLSDFGVKLNAGDSAPPRAPSQDAGSSLKKEPEEG